MRECHVADETFAKKRADAPARAIEKLIGHDEVERPEILTQAAHGARRQDPFDAQQLESKNVGPEVELRRRQPVADAVPREKGDAPAAQRGNDIGPGRIAKWRRDDAFLAVGELGHVVETGAADDADGWIRH
jgi:hypothetical protein